MLGPSLALLTIFFLVPIGVAAVFSAFEWDLLTPPAWVGLRNYQDIGGELFGIALRTLGFSAMVVIGAMSLGLGLALLLDRKGPFYAFLRGSIFSAYVVSWVAVALLWMWILDPDGIAGHALHIGFLGDPRSALVTLAFVTVWKITGYAMILFLAGLQSLPKQLLEAAALDGAGPFARFRWVIWPHLKPTAAFVATTSLVISFQAFDVIRIMTQGGPAKSTTLFVYAIYEQIFLALSVGKASALTMVFFAVLLAIAALQLRAWRSKTRAS